MGQAVTIYVKFGVYKNIIPALKGICVWHSFSIKIYKILNNILEEFSMTKMINSLVIASIALSISAQAATGRTRPEAPGKPSTSVEASKAAGKLAATGSVTAASAEATTAQIKALASGTNLSKNEVGTIATTLKSLQNVSSPSENQALFLKSVSAAQAAKSSKAEIASDVPMTAAQTSQVRASIVEVSARAGLEALQGKTFMAKLVTQNNLETWSAQQIEGLTGLAVQARLEQKKNSSLTDAAAYQLAASKLGLNLDQIKKACL